MSHDYEEELGRSRASRSRRSPAGRMDRGDDGLKVMGDSSIHPVRPSANRPVRAVRREEGGQWAPERGMFGNAGARTGGSGSRRAAGGAGAVSGGAGRTGAGATAGGRAAGGNVSRRTVSAAGSRRTGGGAGGTGGPGGTGGGAGGGSGSGRIGLSLRQERLIAKRRKRRRIIAMILAECITLACIFGYAYFLRQWNQLQRPDYDIKNVENKDISFETVEKMKGYWTIAIFGVDSRGSAVSKGTNADVNIICNINLDTGEIRLVSVFRDTYLNISEEGSYNKINQAYFLGGPEQAVAALNRNLDLNISDYMTFNWKAVADAINILGGVDIELSQAEFYYINSFITETVKVTGIGSYQLKSAGMNHLDGVQAVAYGRLRLMDTDYARTERQRKVIQQAFEKARHADFNTLNRVLGTVFPQVATSINVDDIFTALPMVNKYHIGDTTGFPQARGDAKMGKKGAVVVPQTLESNVVKLHEFLFGDADYVPSDMVKKLSAKISADSGMYKEGKYVDKVPTDGGVIQKPKPTPAPRNDDDDEERETTKKDTGETSRASRETDEDGNFLDPDPDDEDPDENREEEPETDRYGRPIGLRPGVSVQETDEDGNPVEDDEDGQPGNSHGTGTTPTSPGGWERPTEPGGQTYPGGGTYPGVSDRPGAATETDPDNAPGTTWPGGGNPSGGQNTPGSTGPTGGSSVPGSTTPTGGSTPGGTAPGTTSPTGSSTPGGTSPTGSSTPGGTGPAGGSSTPGGGNTPAAGGGPGQGNQLPGSSGGSTPGTPGGSTGPVAGPGH